MSKVVEEFHWHIQKCNIWNGGELKVTGIYTCMPIISFMRNVPRRYQSYIGINGLKSLLSNYKIL